MAWGVFNDSYLEFPPGTVNLASNSADERTIDDLNLKKKGNVVLQPQPSENPNDPLNWSQTWKIAHFLVLAFGAGLTTALAVMPTPGLIPLSEKFKVSSDVASSLVIGAVGFWTAIGSFIIVSAARIWGKRPLYVISIAILVGANVLAYRAESFQVLVAMRTIMGFASAPLFSLITATISDIFFVHERGIFIAIWTVLVSCGGQLGQVIAGFVTQSLGVSATFGFTAIVYAILLPLAYFLVLESAAPRKVGTISRESMSALDKQEKELEQLDDHEDLAKPDLREPYINQLALFRGRVSDSSFWKGALKPLGLFSLPIVLYSTLLFSAFFLFLVGVPILAAVIFSAPPYNLDPSQVGLTNIPLVAVSIMGGPLFGWVSDAVARFMARRNKAMPGVFEPEYRLVLLVVCSPVTTTGLVGFGISTNRGLPLAWLLVWLSMVTLGAMWTTQMALSYVIDCFPVISGQAFSSINLVASIILFVASGSLIQWYEMMGPLVVFGFLATSCIVVTILALPVYTFGKRLRSLFARTEWTQSLLR